MSKSMKILLSGIATVMAAWVSWIVGFFVYIFMASAGFHVALCYTAVLLLPVLVVPLIWLKQKKRFIKFYGVAVLVFAAALCADYAVMKYNESITIDVAPNINVNEYLPFEEESKIVKINSKTLKLSEELPVIDGAAAVFPVYSAFVNAIYPETTRLNDGVFEYNNTSTGYMLLAERKTDIFFGAYPSEEQIAYAEENGTSFEYTPVGSDAFVFFVHKDNPVSSLTADEIRAIYSGKITNWSEVGGDDEEIMAFQRNEGSGSQSMLKRFMGDTPLMNPPSEMVNDLMSGIIEQVADYKSKTNSIGFSFRYYVEGIIRNPDIKMIAVDGTEPSLENIKNGTYPVTGPLYAVTYSENDNENVDKLLEWVLTEEGQCIIEKTGYAGVIK